MRASAVGTHVKAPAANALAMLALSVLRFDGGDARNTALFVATIMTSSCEFLVCLCATNQVQLRGVGTAPRAVQHMLIPTTSDDTHDCIERLNREPEAVVKVEKRDDRLTTRSAYSTQPC